jgi:hypothetical protein
MVAGTLLGAPALGAVLAEAPRAQDVGGGAAVERGRYLTHRPFA